MRLASNPEPVHAAAVGRHVRLGKQKPKKDKRNLKFAAYVPSPSKLPPSPSKVVRSPQIPAWPLYQNDALSDCTCAAIGHQVILHSKYGGRPRTPAEQAVLDLYWATGSADDGRYCLDVLNFWRSSGFAGAPGISAFVELNPKKRAHVKLALHLFGSIYVGLALPLSAQRQARWTLTQGKSAEPGSWGGHAVSVFDYDRYGLTCVTWGAPLKMTWGFFERYCDEAYAVIDPDWIESDATTPDDAGNFDMAQLGRDLDALKK